MEDSTLPLDNKFDSVETEFKYDISFEPSKGELGELTITIIHITKFQRWRTKITEKLVPICPKSMNVILTPEVVFKILLRYFRKNLKDTTEVVLPKSFKNSESSLCIRIITAVDYDDTFRSDIPIEIEPFPIDNETTTDLKLAQRDVVIEGLETQLKKQLVAVIALEEDFNKKIANLTSTAYTKAESDALLSGKASNGAAYTKAESDGLLNAKTPNGTAYTKAEADGKFAQLSAMNQIKTDLTTLINATKAELVGLINQKMQNGTAYTKAESDGKYTAAAVAYTKAESDAKYTAAGVAYTKAESDGKYTAVGVAYTKAESDGKYAPKA